MYSYYPPMQSPFLQQMPQSQPVPMQIQGQSVQIPYVNGKQSAESYQMPASSSVILMDSNSAKFYLKQTDASGQATIKTYDFTESEEDKPKEYVTKEEFESFKEGLKGVKHNESANDANRKRE